MLGCMHALLLATANTDVNSRTSAPAALPLEILKSAGQGELQRVVKWLRKRGPVNALCSAITSNGQSTTFGLLHGAATNGQLEVVRELLKRGASVDLPSSHGDTALMGAAQNGHLSIMLLLLQHSANPDWQNIGGGTALMAAAAGGHDVEACVEALLQRKANTKLLDGNGRTVLWWAENKGNTAIAALIRQHAALPQPAIAAPPCRPTGRWRARGERPRLAARRDPPVGAAGRAAEGGQVAAKGRLGRRTLLW
eukprot:scaffold2360_cov62-Phaeocystis_antarctica.AAC.3